jgi:GxxExxY protein
MKDTEIDDLTHDIIGCAVEIHKAIGNSFTKEIYKTCLAKEFSLQGIDYIENQEMVIYYKDIAVGSLFVDFLVEGKVIIEVKTIDRLEDKHRVQAIKNCTAYKIADGLLLNFGSQLIDCKRVYSKNVE